MPGAFGLHQNRAPRLRLGRKGRGPGPGAGASAALGEAAARSTGAGQGPARCGDPSPGAALGVNAHPAPEVSWRRPQRPAARGARDCDPGT